MMKRRVVLNYVTYINGLLYVRSIKFYNMESALYFISTFLPRLNDLGFDITLLAWKISRDGIELAKKDGWTFDGFNALELEVTK